MATLQEMLLAPDVEPRVSTDVLALVDNELASKSRVSGTAVKVAFKAVTAFAPGCHQETVADMVPADGVPACPVLGGLPSAPGAPTSATTSSSGATGWPRRCSR